MFQTNKQVPHLKLVVDNGKVIDEIEEAKQKQNSLIKYKLTLQTQLQILKETEKTVIEDIDKLETIIKRGINHAKGDIRKS
jgi:hypothetical protein